MNEFMLYHYYRSSCSWRVRWALNYKKISYEAKAINLLENEQNSNSYHEISQHSLVPTLLYKGTPMTESMSILEWLEEKFPEPKLLPSDVTDRQIVRSLAYEVAMNIQPIQNLRVQKYISLDRSKQLEFARHWIYLGFASLEEKLQKVSGDYCFKDELTFADLCLIPQCYNARRFEVDLEKYTNINRVFKNCMKRSDCIESAPESFTPNEA